MQSGILLNTSNTELRTVNNAIIQLGDIDDTGKGRHFRSRFIKDGLVKIEGHGIVLIQKQTIDQSLPSMIGAPVIIKHQDVTEDNADELRCGAISEAYFNNIDGWYYCEGVIWDKKAQDLINKGWSVSCSYDFLSYNNDGGVENNIKYDKEFTSLNFTHLAIVNNPRYERANIVFNCKVENDKWITIKPHGDDSDDYRRLKLEDGESPKEAIDRVYKKKDKEGQAEAYQEGKQSKQSEPPKEKTLEEKRNAYRETLKKLRDAEHKKWQPKDDAEWYQAVKDGSEAKKALTGLRKEYAEGIMSSFEEVKDNPYEDKIADKKARYEELSAKANAEANRYAKTSSDMISGIPMGQPIIGQRDKNYRDKAWGKMEKSWELSKKADYYEDKAKSVGKSGISADDKNAIKKIADKYNALQRTHQKMLDANKIIKSKGSDEEKFAKLVEAGWSEKNAREIMTPTKWSGSVGFQTYELSSNTAEMRRLIDRVIDIHERSLKALEKPAVDYSKYGFTVERNADINRLQLKFNDIPDAETRSKLKHNGFRWSPREKAWQRQMTGNAEYSLKRFVEGLQVNNNKAQDNMILNALKQLISVVENAKDGDDNGRWITIKGTHVFIPDGKSVDEVIEEKCWDSKKQDKQEPEWLQREKQKLDRQTTQMYEDRYSVEHPETYKENLEKAKSDLKGNSKDDELVNVTEDYYNRISKEELQKEFKDIQKEFAKWKDKKNFPEYKGYRNKLLKIKDIYEKRFGKNKADNSKEKDMLLEEIKKLITKVENNKEMDMEIENEKVDKRKLIDEVAGIMKSAGCDDEDIRTAIGKMEKIGYDKSEDGSADNKKVKNEEPEKKDDKKEADKKVENEDAEDEKKVDELKKEEKEDVDNKCKNSKSSFDKINEIYNSIKQVSEEKTYVSRQEKLDNAVEYFK